MQYFMLSLSIKPSPMYKEKFFISKLAITVLMAEQFIWLFFFLTQYIYSYSAAQNNTSESNSKWTFCKPIECISFFAYIWQTSDLFTTLVYVQSSYSSIVAAANKETNLWRMLDTFMYFSAWQGSASSVWGLLCDYISLMLAYNL